MEYKNDMYKGFEKPEDDCDKDGCVKECNLYTGVSVPVEIEPEANVGKIDVECCGDPVIKNECSYDKKHKIVITQKFMIKIPVCYQVKTYVGKCESNCKDKKES